jgi:hypothetical protein
MRSNAEFWRAARAAFVRRYGQPSSMTAGTFTADGRRPLPSETLVWRRDDSTIRLVERDEAASRMTIVYEHATLRPRAPENATEGAARGKATRGSPAPSPAPLD